jgi:GWxTD domain-containing protein
MRAENDKNNFVARTRISYKLVSGYGSTLIIDSATVFFTDTLTNATKNNDIVNGFFDVKAQIGNSYIAEIVMLDLNRNSESFSYLSIDKKSIDTRQNYFVNNIHSVFPIFKNYIEDNDTLKIKYNKKNGVKKLFVKYYNRDLSLPPPPFSYQERRPFNYVPDSIFSFELDDNYTATLVLNARGIYHFATDTAIKDGLTLMKYEHSFPVFDNEIDMIKSLRFITTKQEYDELLSANNLKLALDKYWLKCGSNSKEKASLLIKNYYTRIEKCNTFFNSFDEGWKTDRGLVYLIFGAPNSVLRDNFSETWIYGDETNAMRQVKFIYTKVESPFTDNDYILNRSETYKEIWYRNVDAWRMGRITNEKQ